MKGALECGGTSSIVCFLHELTIAVCTFGYVSVNIIRLMTPVGACPSISLVLVIGDGNMVS